MAVVSMLKVSILILSLNVIVSLQAPAPTLQLRNKYTCLPRNGNNYNYGYNKNIWKNSTICRTEGESPLRYTEMESHIIHSLGLPHFQLTNDK